ncbi:adipocyte plasma membrane-associated protein Hemomucin-like isoform X2 [Prorops nasuta]|uniref:adipocyte plasma membrane-associated protein Hemomucin-like isoform X2 n=1 Tax=Prorops nasuta TaxID=863751 RepID=UPI0034CFB042
MKFLYLSLTVLAFTVGVLAKEEANPKVPPEIPDTTTAIPVTNLTTSTSKPTTSAPVTKPLPPKPTDAPTTTASTSTTNNPTTKPITTEKPITTTSIPSTVPPAPSTTAAPTTPVPTGAPSPQHERHFDGLSFMGGIILTACLVGIGGFSWKFFKTCNERNYRTL